MNWKIGSHTFHLTLTGIALVVGGLYMFFKLGAGNDVAIKAALAGAKQELMAHAAWIKRATVDSDSVVVLRERIAKENAVEVALHKQLNAVLGAPAAKQTPVLFDSAAVSCQAVISSCDSTKAMLISIDSIDAMMASGAAYDASQLADTLRVLRQVEECHLIHIGDVKLFGCPSRFSAFKDGGVVGAIVGFILRGI